MIDDLAAQVLHEGDDDRLRAILEDVCRATQLGFAAIARVTEERWIAAQVLDKIEFGLDPGDELNVKTTICDDIRKCGRMVVIDSVGDDPSWRTHPTPILYGFKSYVSLPVIVDGEIYGTLCAIDPEPRMLDTAETMAAMKRYADKVGTILAERRAGSSARR